MTSFQYSPKCAISPFFLLSCTKFILIFYSSVYPTYIDSINTSTTIVKARLRMDTSVEYASAEHIILAIASGLTMLILVVPFIVLALYPTKTFISALLSRLKLSGHSKVALHIFVQKSYSCCRDCTDGGHDMKPFASLYFFLRFVVLTILIWKGWSTYLILFCHSHCLTMCSSGRYC